MDTVLMCARDCGFQSPILDFLKSYRVLQKSLEPSWLEKLEGNKKLLEGNDQLSDLRLHFIGLLEADYLPKMLRVHFISRACSVQQIFPDIFCPADKIVLAANLDKASRERIAGFDQFLQQHRLQLSGSTSL